MEYNYITERYEKQIEYYSSKCIECRKKYHFWPVTSIICSALIPVITLGIDLNFVCKILVALLGSVSTICSSILLHFRYQELWFRYRNTHSELKAEYEQYRSGIGSYKSLEDKDSIAIFAESCEKIIEQEHSSWKAVYSKSNVL